MVGTWKVLGKSSPGSGTEFGADDTDKINKLLRGDLDVDTVEINSPFRFKDNKLIIRDALNLKNYTIRTSGIIGDREITLPLLTANDTFVFNDHAATLTQKILAGARISNYMDVESTSTPANPGANILRIYRRSSDNALVYRTNAGVETVLSGGGGGGEINTASNIGTAGTGLFKTKVGFDLQFKKLNTATGGLITITDDLSNNEVDLKITPGNQGEYLMTDAGGVVWTRPGLILPDDSLYNGKRWGSLMGGAMGGSGLFSGMTLTGNINTDGGVLNHRTTFKTGAVDLAVAGWQTSKFITRGAQNPKLKARYNVSLSTERSWFGFINNQTFPQGTNPLVNQSGILIGFNETDTNWMVRWNNGGASPQSASTGILKDTNFNTMEVMITSAPAVSAWFNGTQIVNASTTQAPTTTTDVITALYSQSVGGQDVGPSVDWAMMYFDPVL